MKQLFNFWLAALLLSAPAWSQVSQDSITAKNALPVALDTAAVQTGKMAAADSSATGAAGNGRAFFGFKRGQNSEAAVDSFKEKGKGLKGGTDKFIDADGDGICDGREAGMGFQHGKTGSIREGGDKGGRGKQRQGRGKK